jgi:hypothetical protein
MAYETSGTCVVQHRQTEIFFNSQRWRSTYFERNLSTRLGFGWEVLAGGMSWRMVVAIQETLSERPWEALKSAAKGVKSAI